MLHDSRKTRITKFTLHKDIAKKILVNDRLPLAIFLRYVVLSNVVCGTEDRKVFCLVIRRLNLCM